MWGWREVWREEGVSEEYGVGGRLAGGRSSDGYCGTKGAVGFGGRKEQWEFAGGPTGAELAGGT